LNVISRTNWDKSVNLLTIDGLHYRGTEFDSLEGQNLFIFIALRLALGPTQFPTEWTPWLLSPVVKWPEGEADQSSPSSAEVRNSSV
jgi:hypothetical protein